MTAQSTKYGYYKVDSCWCVCQKEETNRSLIYYSTRLLFLRLLQHIQKYLACSVNY